MGQLRRPFERNAKCCQNRSAEAQSERGPAMSLFVVKHEHSAETCPAGDPQVALLDRIWWLSDQLTGKG